MKIHQPHQSPELRLAAALAHFEHEFTYPLGPDRRFRIAHGDAGNALNFFRALGDPATYVVAEQDDRIIGTIGAVWRHIVRPDGSAARGLYLGDLKIVPHARGGLVLSRLLRAVKSWANTQAVRGEAAAYSIVMDGTAQTPENYSGRLGLPAFTALGAASILWLHTAGEATPAEPLHEVSPHQGQAAFLTLTSGCYHLPESHPQLRSECEPCWWVTSDSQACGRLEDTVLSKRLWTTTGEEMRSAHLSQFAFSVMESGISVLSAALAHAATAGYPMLFVAVPPTTTERWRQHFGKRLHSVASATIFGTSTTLPPGAWLINTADI